MYPPPTGSDVNGPYVLLVPSGAVTLMVTCHLSPVAPAAVGGTALSQKTISICWPMPTTGGEGAT